MATNMETFFTSPDQLRFIEIQNWGDHVWNFTHERARVGRDGDGGLHLGIRQKPGAEKGLLQQWGADGPPLAVGDRVFMEGVLKFLEERP